MRIYLRSITDLAAELTVAAIQGALVAREEIVGVRQDAAAAWAEWRSCRSWRATERRLPTSRYALTPGQFEEINRGMERNRSLLVDPGIRQVARDRGERDLLAEAGYTPELHRAALERLLESGETSIRVELGKDAPAWTRETIGFDDQQEYRDRAGLMSRSRPPTPSGYVDLWKWIRDGDPHRP